MIKKFGESLLSGRYHRSGIKVCESESRGKYLAFLGTQEEANKTVRISDTTNIIDSNANAKKAIMNSINRENVPDIEETKMGIEHYGPLEIKTEQITEAYNKLQEVTRPFMHSHNLLSLLPLLDHTFSSNSYFIKNIIEDILSSVFEVLENDIRNMILVDENLDPVFATATEKKNEIIILQNITLHTININTTETKGNTDTTETAEGNENAISSSTSDDELPGELFL